jgi:hypothetical protein
VIAGEQVHPLFPVSCFFLLSASSIFVLLFPSVFLHNMPSFELKAGVTRDSFLCEQYVVYLGFDLMH